MVGSKTGGATANFATKRKYHKDFVSNDDMIFELKCKKNRPPEESARKEKGNIYLSTRMLVCGGACGTSHCNETLHALRHVLFSAYAWRRFIETPYSKVLPGVLFDSTGTMYVKRAGFETQEHLLGSLLRKREGSVPKSRSMSTYQVRKKKNGFYSHREKIKREEYHTPSFGALSIVMHTI